jgi:hypothetical protein
MTAVTPATSTTCGPANHRSRRNAGKTPSPSQTTSREGGFSRVCAGLGRSVWFTDLACFVRRLAAATHGVRTAPARITAVTAARATQARVLAEPDVVVALRLLATILDSGPTRSCECAAFGVDHAAQRAGLLPTIGQAAATVDALTAAAAILLLRPDRSRHRDACKGQKGRPQVLENSTSHRRISLEKQLHGIPALTKTGPLMSSRANAEDCEKPSTVRHSMAHPAKAPKRYDSGLQRT